MAKVERMELVPRAKIRKRERRRQILLELKLHPHVRISELADRFGVSTETVRRDMDALSEDGLINRAHGGASAPALGHYPGLDERSEARKQERERIGLLAAGMVQPGETLMIDAGSTTLQFARFLAFSGTPCTVVTNCLPVAMALGHGAAEVILCPGDFLGPEAAVVGPETVEFLLRHNADHCFIGAAGLSPDGVSESVRGFAAVKRAMLARCANRHLLIDGEKFGNRGLSQIGGLDILDSVIVDRAPNAALRAALVKAKIDLHVATKDALAQRAAG